MKEVIRLVASYTGLQVTGMFNFSVYFYIRLSKRTMNFVHGFDDILKRISFRIRDFLSFNSEGTDDAFQLEKLDLDLK